jgi:uncharacterized membrane protein YjdF
MPANIPSYHMYLATTFEVIGWWGAVAKTINEAINLSA